LERTFNEVRNRELLRINKENALLLKFQQNGRILEDRLMKR
jgi:hypothetical protein